MYQIQEKMEQLLYITATRHPSWTREKKKFTTHGLYANLCCSSIKINFFQEINKTSRFGVTFEDFGS